MINIECPICGNTKPLLLSRTGQYKLPANVSICQNDGLVYLNPRWDKSSYDKFYKYSYDSYYRNNIDKNESFAHAKEIHNRLSNNNDFQPKSILDIGAGNGYVLEYLKETYKSCQTISAIESSKDCIKNLKNNVGAEIISTDIDNISKDKHIKKYDLIILRHVLEHFLFPIKALEIIRSLLNPNGILYIAVPDMMHPRGSLHYYWFRSVHTFYFSKPTLLEMVSKVGLSSIKVGSENNELWGLFNNSNIGQNLLDSPNIYVEQLNKIKKYRRKHYHLDLMEYLKQTIIKSLPKETRHYLREKYIKLKM